MKRRSEEKMRMMKSEGRTMKKEEMRRMTGRAAEEARESRGGASESGGDGAFTLRNASSRPKVATPPRTTDEATEAAEADQV